LKLALGLAGYVIVPVAVIGGKVGIYLRRP